MLAHRFSQRSGAEAVDDAHRLLAFEQRAIEKLVGLVERLLHSLADEIQFRRGLKS